LGTGQAEGKDAKSINPRTTRHYTRSFYRAGGGYQMAPISNVTFKRDLQNY
jgi:hypothetical protein